MKSLTWMYYSTYALCAMGALLNVVAHHDSFTDIIGGVTWPVVAVMWCARSRRAWQLLERLDGSV